MRKNALLIGLLAVAMLACSCRSNGREQTECDGESAVSDTLPRSVHVLPLPEVPSALTAPEERTAYILERFWDGMDFRDTLRSHKHDFMEQNLVNFLSLFPHARQESLSSPIGKLLKHAVADSVAFNLVCDLAERYLNDPNSPMRNEGYYIMFLEEMLRLPALAEHHRIRFTHQLTTAKKNRPGMVAADFAYILREGGRRTLHSTRARRLLLLFYDPECEHCTDILRQMYENELIGNLIAAQKLSVLAIYAEGNRDVWDATKSSMPQEWSVGMDDDGILEHELYSLPAMPVAYLLDENKKVLLKDPPMALLNEVLMGGI